jgi:hypothetical protein
MEDKAQIIREALEKLDPENNEQWTNDNLPQIGVVQELTGLKGLKRGEITAAAPLFTRESLDLGTHPVEKDEDPEVVTEEEDEDEIEEDEDEIEEEETDPNEIIALEKQLAKVNELYQKAQVQADAALADVRRAEYDRDKLIEKMEKIQDPKANQHAIADFIKGQQKLREERAVRQQRLMALGIDQKLQSPIDAAMSRKNSRGAKRPEYPMAKKEG